MATYDQIDDLVSGNETATTDSGGKHGKFFFINVPNYYGALSLTPAYDTNGILTDASVKTSFVRIGAPPAPVATSWTQDPGANLVRMAYVVGPAGKEEDPAIKARFTQPALPNGAPNPEYDAGMAALSAAGVAICSPYIDDRRDRGTGNQNPTGSLGHGLDLAGRKAVSDKLQSNVGWRDHADGNRITTTAGDKIEVIQGNYKLIVMGRQSDPGQAMGWEATGNNVQDFAGATMPGASVTVTWITEAYIDPADVPAAQAKLAALNARRAWIEQRVPQIDARIAELNQQIPRASTSPQGRGGPSQKQKLEAERSNLQREKTTLAAELTALDATDIPAAQQAIADAIAFNASYQGGAWLLQNSTERVYQYSRNAGNFKEENWGDLWETYVGSENPVRVGKKATDGTQGHPTTHYQYNSRTAALSEPMPTTSSVGLPRGNPHIIEKTWASKIESYTGSAAWRIPSIHEETWATTMRDETHCTGTITSRTWANETDEETHIDKSTSKTFVSGAALDVTAAGAATDITVAAAKTDITISANNLELTAGLLHESFELTVATFELYLGVKLAIAISDETEISLGSRVAINVAKSVEFNVGGKLEVNPADETKLVLTKTGISLATKLLGANYQIG